MEELKIYRFYIVRNKGKISISKLKKQLLKTKGNTCYLCNQNFNNKIHSLELEHKVPVMLGGNIFHLDNLDLVCIRCHKKKTIIDKRIIQSLKTLGIINGKREIISLMNLEELKNYYKQYFSIALKSYEYHNDWNVQSSIYLEENRYEGYV